MMYLSRTASMFQVTLVFLILGVAISKKCLPSKDMMFTPNLKVSLNASSDDHVYIAEDAIHLRSLSPWKYSMDKDENRFPPVIAEAICRHDTCLDSEGKVDLSMSSVPIKRETLVLRREIKDCHQSFRLEKQLVTVGCTCIRPVIQPPL